MNNISAKEPSPFTAHTNSGELSALQSSNVNVVNNIIYGSPNVPMTPAGLTSVTNLYWDYNIMFNGVGANPSAGMIWSSTPCS